jgi:S1-C subfamily serine protease
MTRRRLRTRAARLGAAAILGGLGALATASCGKEDARVEVVRPTTVERTTRVEVLRDLDETGRPAGGEDGAEPARGAFDPVDIYEREGRGVVTIISTGLRGAAGRPESSGQGSGFVISERGEVVTNAHVVTTGEGAAIRKAREVFVRFPDRNQVPAKIVGFDPFSDVALLKVDPGGLRLRPLPLGSTRGLAVGAPVVAIGSPFGEEQSLSVGVISALDRQIDSLTGFTTIGAVQTDAAINQGNSGGPLLDARGDVLGINSQIRTQSGAGTGVGFAVPVDTVKRSVGQLRRTGKVQYAYLGISSTRVYPQLAERFRLPTRTGAWVQTVSEGGPADDAGIRAGSGEQRFQAQPWRTGGDLIVAVDDVPVRDEDDLSQALVTRAPGDVVTLRLYRGGKLEQVRVTLGERPLDAPRR